MEMINKIETRVASWYQKAPHLPEGGRKRLADNIWWLVMIAVIVGSLGLFGIILIALIAGALAVGLGGFIGAAIAGVAITVLLIVLAFTSITLILSALAIAPLQAKRKKGWTLLFIVLLIGVASSVVTFLLSFELVSFLSGLLFLALAGYLLFEVREYFGTTAVADADSKKQTPPAETSK